MAGGSGRSGRGLYDELSGRRGAAAFGGTGVGDVFRAVQGNDLSEVIEELLNSPDSMIGGLDGLGNAEKLEVTRKYCDSSLEEIRALYGECCRAYYIGAQNVNEI